MTVTDAIAFGRDRLRTFGTDGRFDALRLLEETLERDASWIIAHGEDPLSPAQTQRYETDIGRRATGEPVAYIVGSAGFYGRTFVVSPDVLVPRPESEGVVEIALGSLRAGPVAVCDVGTGSGVLALTLACERADASVTAIDVSPAALAIARTNAGRLGVAQRVRFVMGNALDELALEDRFDCIVANLPYVRRGDLNPAPDATAFEPVLALDGGDDGLDVYRALLARAPAHLRAGGTLVMEAGPDTVPALATLAEATFAAPAEIVVHRDLALHERIVVVHLKPAAPPAIGQG